MPDDHMQRLGERTAAMFRAGLPHCNEPSPGGRLRCYRPPHLHGGHRWDMHTLRNEHYDGEEPG